MAERENTRSKERVRDLAEVFTAPREADAMLDLVDEAMGLPRGEDERVALIIPEQYLAKKYLEPSCGDGNFLVRILERKLRAAAKAEPDRIAKAALRQANAEGQRRMMQTYREWLTVLSLTATYGIDIAEDNVADSRERLRDALQEHWASMYPEADPRPGFWETVDYVLDRNVILGDSLTDRGNIHFVDFVPGVECRRRDRFDMGRMMAQESYSFAEILENEPKDRMPEGRIPARHYLRLGDDTEGQVGR